MRRPLEALIFCSGILTFIFIIHSNYTENRSSELRIRPRRREGLVTIYSATSYFGSKIEDRWSLWRCKDIQEWCHFTDDPLYRQIADGVIFHANNFQLDLHPRSPDQVYIWFTGESAVHQVIKMPKNYINWTMTYRIDSDVWYPYSRMKELTDSPDPFDFDDIWASKSKISAWVGSNCLTDNRRTEMIYLLQDKGLQIDIFGSCGKAIPSCGRFSKGSANCRAKAMKPYKFYIAFENSNCLDYVTEKLFNSLDSYLAVPIVIKRDYYRNYGIPDGAYIAIEDFESIEELIDHITTVGSNKTEYLKYHNWRKTHRVAPPGRDMSFCGLCRQLRERNKEKSKSYADLAEWFNPSLSCEQRLLDKYLGRSLLNRILCRLYSIIFFNFHWDCS